MPHFCPGDYLNLHWLEVGRAATPEPQPEDPEVLFEDELAVSPHNFVGEAVEYAPVKRCFQVVLDLLLFVEVGIGL